MTNRDLETHNASEGARRRAEAAGLDIDALKRDDPVSYMMLCSQPVLHAAPQLKELASPALEAALADQQLFEAESQGRLLVLAFPGVGREQLRLLDELMGEVVEEALDRYAYYRVVQDQSGTTRELDLPTGPEEWQGTATMVGPFANEGEASAWGQERVVPRAGLTYDVLPYAGAWFCDIFTPGETGA